ncbi:hypothetical protein R1sor_006268 [Riccia sorocarpa]|uniref:Uncharacterized protein n=1 Tax=Riccia sorocarpa TaxID=122646 RepID=A0ABD3HPX7_9MARC
MHHTSGRLDDSCYRAMYRSPRNTVELSNISNDYRQSIVLEAVESKLKSYAEMTREMTRDTQTSILQDREKELAARDLRAKNLRIVGMTESEGENIQEVVVDLLRDTLQLDAPRVDHAIRVGKGDRGSRPIFIRFATVDARNNALSHWSKLRGKSLWLDPDLTPLQVEDRKKKIQKVKDTSSAGLIVYMRDGKTVITDRHRDNS